MRRRGEGIGNALGVLPLPGGERVGVRGFEAHREILTPHPTPLPRGEGPERARGTSVGMKRRAFITLIGGSAIAWPLAARGQQDAIPVIGFVSAGGRGALRRHISAFQEGLKEFGYVEGQNVAVEYRFAE